MEARPDFGSWSTLLETAGAVLVVSGLALAWLPLGLIAMGILLILLAAGTERPAVDRPNSRVW